MEAFFPQILKNEIFIRKIISKEHALFIRLSELNYLESIFR